MQDGEDLRLVPISDVAAVPAILINAAKELRATSYVDVLDALGIASPGQKCGRSARRWTPSTRRAAQAH
jgi:hypothetical protein